jgi:2-polyprenyl-3-methyl-5-hydroxy-6-metoxy-1,4-benzoquinol methylase
MQLVSYNKCPLCNSGHFHTYKKIKDHSITKEVFTISECTTCHLLFTNPIPDEDNIGRYYKSSAYISHTNKANNPVNFLYKIVRKFTLLGKISLIKKYGGNSLLDVGCGTGLFLEEAYKKGFTIKGVETDSDARLIQSQLISNQVVDSISKLPVKDKYDVITLWHVLEHIHHLNNRFQQLSEVLKRKGYIFVAVPNPESWDAKHYEEYWAAWDVPRHLYHFRKKNIKQLFHQHNISLVEMIPMKFDSFYVSMLSEKYKGNSIINQLFKGFINGIKSNFKAENKNYSSTIYIGQKNE